MNGPAGVSRLRGRFYLPQLQQMLGVDRSLAMARIAFRLALVMALVLTSYGAASARGAAPAVDRMVICAGHDVVVVYLDAEGHPTHAPHLCPDCVMHLLADVPAPMSLAAPGQLRQLAWQDRVTSQDVRRPSLPISSRGPPVSSI